MPRARLFRRVVPRPWPPAPGSSAAAAAPRPTTSRRCGRALDRAIGRAGATAAAPRAARARGGRPGVRATAGAATPGRRPRRRRGDAPPRHRPARSSSRAGRFVVSVEIDPPRSVRIDRTLDAARLLRDAGVDCVNICDSAMARVRMGALAVAFGIQHELDLECLVHLTTRDRNLMALESELLGAHALGMRNILALTGDPPRIGDYPTGTGIWDVDSIGLDRDPGPAQPGRGPGRGPDRAAGRVHDRLRARPDRGRPGPRMGPPGAPKLAAGAHLVMTQPLYDAPGGGDAGRGAARFGPAGFPVRCSWASCRSTPRATPSSSTTRCPASRSRTPARGDGSAGERGAEVGLEMAMALLAAVVSAVAGTY